MRSKGVTLKVNLLGIVNLISVSNLISRCEILSDAASGSVTIKETAASERISAISDPYARQEALRKALFESVLVTTTYRASGAVAMPELALRESALRGQSGHRCGGRAGLSQLVRGAQSDR